MARTARRNSILVDNTARSWTTLEDIFLMDNQDMPIGEQAIQLGCTEDEVSSRRSTLGILRRMQSIKRMSV